MRARTANRMLNPATRLLWRSGTTAQLELGGRAVVIEGFTARAVRRLAAHGPGSAAAGAGSAPSSAGAGGSSGAPAGSADEQARQSRAEPALRVLAEAGFLWPRCSDGPDDRLTPPHPRLAPELAALDVEHGERAAEVLDARRHLSVTVQGTGRAGPHIAALLAAAGIGHIHVLEPRAARLNQAVPGGLLPGDEGRSLTAAAAAAIERAAPDARTQPFSLDEQPDLVILACDEPVDPERRGALHARHNAHLLVRLAPDHGVVGPLVIPGLTSCLRCADLHRLDRDPAWSALAAQLAVPPRRGTMSGAALSTVMAGVAAQQALSFLDGGQPATIDGTLEQHLPDWRIRRRSWPAHPDCDCAPSR